MWVVVWVFCTFFFLPLCTELLFFFLLFLKMRQQTLRNHNSEEKRFSSLFKWVAYTDKNSAFYCLQALSHKWLSKSRRETLIYLWSFKAKRRLNQISISLTGLCSLMQIISFVTISVYSLPAPRMPLSSLTFPKITSSSLTLFSGVSYVGPSF